MTPILEKTTGLIEHAKAVHTLENTALELSKRIIVTSLPMLLVSFILPSLLPLIEITTVFVLYHMVKDLYQKAILIDHSSFLWFASLPVYLFFFSWCLILALTDRTEGIASISTYFLLAVICLWPTFVNRKKFIERKKKSPFKPLYLAVTGLIAAQQLIIIIF
jgi:hypothetical protein